MSLSDSQQQSLDQLLAITSSASDDDLARDVRILRETGWNVQAAVEVIFSSAPTASSSSSAAAPPPQHTSPRSGAPYSAFTVDDSHQGQPALPPNGLPPPSPGGLGARRTAGFRVPRGVRGISRVGLGVGWALYSIILWPVGVLWGLLGGGWGWIIRALPPSIRNLIPRAIMPTTLPSSSSSSRSRGPATLTFVRSLEALTNARSPSTLGERSLAQGQASTSTSTVTSPLLDDQDEPAGAEDEDEERRELPEFFIGRYKDALELAKKDARVLLVGLFSGVHEGDEAFKKSVLTDPLLVKTLKQHKVLFWAGDVQDREPYQVSRLLPPTTYPSLSFISLLPSNPSSPSPFAPASAPTLKLTILSRLEGAHLTSALITTTLTQSVLPRVAPVLQRIQREKRLREEERRLREDQDRAFRESEAKDLERIMAKRGEREAEERRVSEERDADERRVVEERQREEKKERRQRYLRWVLNPASNILPTEPAPGEEGAVAITLRVPPQPKPYKRRFPASTPLTTIYLWAETLTLPIGTSLSTEPASSEGGADEFAFRLATSYPRKVVEVTEGDGTVGGSEVLKKGAGVVVLEWLEEGGNGSGRGLGGGQQEGGSNDESDEDEGGGSN